ncbi:hypothetical protein BQ8794_110138 [Mesorhizobium prunaredense]|uniref:Uncharacterized protein n=1 Tax=Mesorhizobium prunaredense TaxID=1631249 RepID=A0A1R3V0C4_9HYPH|nr:hypothetical protein BQ8794_110138 [Mesorhizobium prunaredense]
MVEAESPKTDVMALARAVIDGLLEPNVLRSPKEIQSAERRGGIGRVQQKRSYHPPRTCHSQTVGRGPTRCCKGFAELLKSADEDEIYRIAGQTISGDCVPRDEFAMKNLQAHSDHVWQNNIGGQAVRKTHCQEPWKSVVRSIENDEDYQPNADYAQKENQDPLAKARQQSQNTFSRLAPDELSPGWVFWRPRLPRSFLALFRVLASAVSMIGESLYRFPYSALPDVKLLGGSSKRYCPLGNH